MGGKQASFRDNINLAYIYCVQDMGNKVFAFGIDPDPNDPADFGSPMVYTDALYRASLGTPSVDDVSYEDRWGRFYSAYSPVFNSEGKVGGLVAVDFDATWYEAQLNQNTRTIIIACALSLAVGIVLVLYLTRQYSRRIGQINSNLSDLQTDMHELTGNDAAAPAAGVPERHGLLEDSLLSRMDATIADLHNDLRQHVSQFNTHANSMITAMASDYRCVYYVNLDEDMGICFRGDPSDIEQTPEGVQFPYLERLTWYANTSVTESYRAGFLSFIDPDNIRQALSKQPLIAYRYLARREGREYLEKIGASARHLLGLINDILDMSRIESGRLVLRKEEFSFSAMLEQINTMVMSQCSDKGLTYECRMLSVVDDCYIGDDMKLKEVLINILSNAIKFTNAPGSVTMTVERTAQYENQSTLCFCIKDTGIGMDKEFIPKIFEAFSQEDGSRKNKYGSTGLGMAITKSIVEMMNGSIAVESEKGVGTEFAVTVTLKNSEHKNSERDNSIDLRTLRVLVVDDDPVAVEHARMVLEEAGIRADVCTSGEEALRMIEVQHAKQEPYNLVLMDWSMPNMNGMQATAAIRALDREDARSIPIIALTANAFDEDVQRGLQAGMNAHLSKPVESEHLMQTLGELIYEAEEAAKPE